MVKMTRTNIKVTDERSFYWCQKSLFSHVFCQEVVFVVVVVGTYLHSGLDWPFGFQGRYQMGQHLLEVMWFYLIIFLHFTIPRDWPLTV